MERSPLNGRVLPAAVSSLAALVSLWLACGHVGDEALEPGRAGRDKAALAGPPGTVAPSDKLLLRARSDDGTRWDKLPGVLVTGGSSPQLVRIGDRRVVLYVQDGERVATVPFDGGEPRPLPLDGEEPGLVVDPHAVALPGGGYRLYYIHQPERRDPGMGMHNEVHSAISTDGATWAREPGLRLEGELVDPDVVALPGGGWRMFVTVRATRVHSAFAADGLAFAPEDGTRYEGGGVTSTLWHDGRWSMFLHHPTDRPTRLYRATSTDGLTFVGDPVAALAPDVDGADRRGIESPSVLVDDDGWWMVYAAIAEDAEVLP